MLRFAVRIKPGANRDAVGGNWEGQLGTALILAVKAPAVEGKANAAVKKLLAKALGVRPRDVEVVQGKHSRDKLVEVTGLGPNAVPLLAALRGTENRS